MIPQEVRQEIDRRLARAEAEHGVRILFAIESGSRAWGFASPNSDYDVRFVYAHEPRWYQAVDLEERRDVIEYPITDEIDLNGWDLRKALRLYWKSNPAMVEWLQSPITYLERGGFRRNALALLPQLYSLEKGIHHYRSMARGNYREYLCGDEVKLKKYFYVLRALLAVRWISAKEKAPPIEFATLLPMVNDEPQLLTEIDRLLEKKRTAPELGRAAAVPLLNAFIEKELAQKSVKIDKGESPTSRIEQLNTLFHATLEEASD